MSETLLYMHPEPFRIEPAFSPRIWGARSLAPMYPEKTNLAEPIGEAWLTGVDCRVATGPFAGRTLREAWREMPAEWRGSRFAEPSDFPLLVKFIFPTDKLSIQVHPDDAYAGVHEKAVGGRGKTEMWHVVSAETGARVLVGLKPGTTKEKFLAALQAQTLEDLFIPYTVSPGDTFFLPPRTPHTIGPGMILCEVQQYSDLTYRVYDYGRLDAHGKPRELHLQKALDVLNFGSPSHTKVPSLPLPSDRNKRTLLAACRYFATERWDLVATMQTQVSGSQFELLIILAGSGSIHWNGSPLLYKRGQCWFLPACLGKFSVQPEQTTSIVRTLVADVALLRGQLRNQRLSEHQLAQAIFE